jgi:nucleotide-binding universal stress UspA family protein
MHELIYDALTDQRPIVVGVDGSPGATSALGWAIEEARRREVVLEVGVAWRYPAEWAEGFNAHWADDEEALEAEAAAVAARALGQLLGETPPPPWIRVHVEKGAPAAVLLGRAAAASMLVVGRGHLAIAGLGLGSVSRACVHHSPCALVVIPPYAAAT